MYINYLYNDILKYSKGKVRYKRSDPEIVWYLKLKYSDTLKWKVHRFFIWLLYGKYEEDFKITDGKIECLEKDE